MCVVKFVFDCEWVGREIKLVVCEVEVMVGNGWWFCGCGCFVWNVVVEGFYEVKEVLREEGSCDLSFVLFCFGWVVKVKSGC